MSGGGPAGVARARCRNHGEREAVARCPACGNTFCRECITEHEGRMMCTGCLAALLAERPARRGRQVLRRAALWGLAGVSVVLAWSFFVLVGRVMILLRDLREGLGG